MNTSPTTQPSAAPQQTVPILDFGAQYVQLIARRVREAGVHSVLVPPTISLEQLRALNPIGIILSGGPASVYEEGAPRCDKHIFDLGVPVLGICYGMQLAAQLLGGDVKPGEAREYGRVKLQVIPQDSGLKAQDAAQDLFAGVPTDTTVWMSHGDQVQSLGSDFVSLASTPTCPMAAMRHKSRPFFGVQFHPEVTHTPHGTQIIENFLYKVCRAAGTWRMGSFVETAITAVRNQVKGGHVICGLSGGVDSSVLAALLHKAIGNQLTCIFVDNGLLRKNERQSVEATFRDHFKIDLRVVDASKEFLTALKGVTEPQEKRKIIGKTFIDVFKREAGSIKDAKFLAQGTLYPDVIESGHSHLAGGSGVKNGVTANIKLHHNVGGLPEQLGFELVEPLRDLFKDEVRKLGELLGLPEHIVWRHPFPGPGLAVRCIGEITEEKLAVLRDADEIFLEEIIAEGLYRSTAQTFAAILPVRAVGVMGDGRSYQHVIALRSVDTSDFMTADWSRIPYEVLARVSNRIVNEVRGISRVVYDITSKPPGTIEWE